MWSYARRGAGVPLTGSREQRAGSGVSYRLGQSTPHVIMPIRPRLSRPPRILIASDQNHALSDVVRSLGRRGYSVLRVFADASVLERARPARPDVLLPEAGTDGLDSLRGVARLLEASGRRSDAIGRIGPAEFAVVAAGVNRAGARQLANRLRDSVGVELRAGYDAIGSRRAGALEGRGLLARAARALEMAKLEGKWVKEARE